MTFPIKVGMLYSAEPPDQNNKNFKNNIQPMTFPIKVRVLYSAELPDHFLKQGANIPLRRLSEKRSMTFYLPGWTLLRVHNLFFLACSQTIFRWMLR